MYRHVIEHPAVDPAETQKKLDLRAGHDKGRIYRVYPRRRRSRGRSRGSTSSSTPDLVAALDSPNGWQRDMAHMLLVWRHDRDGIVSAVPRPLDTMVRESKNPLARLHALSVLDGIESA